MKRRVVITGLGAVTPIGNTVEEFWEGVRKGACGIGTITKFDTTEYKVHLAGEVKGFVAKERMDFKAARRMGNFSQYAVAAAKEAFADAGISMEEEDPVRVGVLVGSGVGDLAACEQAKAKIDAEAEVSTTELAAILGVTARRVQQMAQDGTIVPVRRGYFQLGDAVQRYINFLSKPQISEAEQKLETAKRQSEAQLKLSKAQLAKMEVEELKGKLHRSEDVEGFTEDLIYTIRAALLSLPGRLSVDVTAAQSPAEAAEIIRKEVHKVMRELAAYHYDPEKYAEKVNERRDWSNAGRSYDEE